MTEARRVVLAAIINVIAVHLALPRVVLAVALDSTYAAGVGADALH